MACRNCTSNSCQCVVIGDGDVVNVTGAGDSLSPYIISVDICEAIADLPTAAFVSGVTPVVIQTGDGCALATITTGGGGGGGIECETNNSIRICGTSNTFTTTPTNCAIVSGASNNITNSLNAGILSSASCSIVDSVYFSVYGSSSIVGSIQSNIEGGAFNTIIGGFMSEIENTVPASAGTGNVILSGSLVTIRAAVDGITASGSNLVSSSVNLTLDTCIQSTVIGNVASRTFTGLDSCFIQGDTSLPNSSVNGVAFGGSRTSSATSSLLGFRGATAVQAPYLNPGTATVSDVVNALIAVGILAVAA